MASPTDHVTDRDELQARIAASLNTSYHVSGRRILATVLVALLSTCVAGIVIFAALV